MTVDIDALNSEQNDEREWIARAQAGDKAAYGRLVQRYRRLAVSVAYHHGLDLATAEDVAQEAFVKAWLALPCFSQSKGNWRAWLCRIVINLALDTHRRARPADELDENMPNGESNLADQAEARAAVQAVRRALAQLPPASRAALILRAYEGLSYAEIADALNIPLGTVMSRLNYARSRLRELLVERGEAR